MGVRGCLKEKECWWASQSVCLHSSLSGRDVHRANKKHMRTPVRCQLVIYPHARGHTHTQTTHAHTYSCTIPAIAPSLLRSFWSFFFPCFSFMFSRVAGLDYAFAGFCVVLGTLCYGYDITTLPHGVLYTYTGDSETPEVYHTAQRRLRGHLRQSHIQASRAFYVKSLIRGFYGKTLTILSSLLWGRMSEWEEEM